MKRYNKKGYVNAMPMSKFKFYDYMEHPIEVDDYDEDGFMVEDVGNDKVNSPHHASRLIWMDEASFNDKYEL